MTYLASPDNEKMPAPPTGPVREFAVEGFIRAILRSRIPEHGHRHAGRLERGRVVTGVSEDAFVVYLPKGDLGG